MSVPISVPQTPTANTSTYYTSSQYTPSQYTPSQYTPSQYTPSQYTSTQYTPTQYTPTQYTPAQIASLYNSYASGSYSFANLPQLAGLSSTLTAPPVPQKTTGTGSIRPSSPVQAGVTGREASQAVQRLIASELGEAGFSGAKADALYSLEMEVVNFVQDLYQCAHEYANLANRSGPIATDLLLASEEFDKDWSYKVGPEKMVGWTRKRQRRREKKKMKNNASLHAPSLVPPPSRSPSPELLQSDDDMDTDDITSSVSAAPPPTPTPAAVPMAPPTAHPSHLSLTPASLTASATTTTEPPKTKHIPAMTLRNLPGNLPSLPPKHTYLQTPAPTRAQAAQSTQNNTSSTNSTEASASSSKSQNQIQMEKKLRTASLVQESLKNLLLATEDTGTNQEDAELLGHIVNWESTAGLQNGLTRKRWRV